MTETTEHTQSAYMGASQVVQLVKESATNAGDTRDASLTPRLGRSPGGGNGNPLQYSCLKNSMNGGTCQAPWDRKESDTTE